MTGIIITTIICVTIIILFVIAIKFNFICNHQWEKKSDINVYDEFDNNYPVMHKYVCQCTKCGKIKTFRS